MRVRELIAHLAARDPDEHVGVLTVGSEGLFVETRIANIDSIATIDSPTSDPAVTVWLAGADIDIHVELPATVEYRCRCGIVHATSLDPADEYCPLHRDSS